MIKNIAHIADIHIRKALARHSEYRLQFQRLKESLIKTKPDRIVIVGDLYHDFIDIEGEALVLAAELLHMLREIAPVILTRGNHDFRKKDHKRIDVIKTLMDSLKTKNITYYEETGFYKDDNVTWAVWHHPEKEGPWKKIEHERDPNQIYIDLFHDPIYASISCGGWKMEDSYHIKPEQFLGKYALCGDIHQRQFLRNDKRVVYCGSLIQQNYEESLDGHGYIMWDIEKGTMQEIDLEYDFAHYTIDANQVDCDKLDFEIENIAKHPRIKIVWNDYKANMNKVSEKKLRDYVRNKFEPIEIKFDKRFIPSENVVMKKAIESKNIEDVNVQAEIFGDFLKENKFTSEDIEAILEIDREVTSRLGNIEKVNTNYSLLKLWIDNFKSYGSNNVLDFNDMQGIIQITGINQQGKTTLLDSICYLLFGKTLDTLVKEKHGDNRFINNKRDLNYCQVMGVLDLDDNNKFLLVRRTDRKYNKSKSSLTDVTTSLSIYDASLLDLENITEEYLDSDEAKESAFTGERFLDTQKILEKHLGEFDDFIRLALTNADNLNNLLSINRSTFIDSVLNDAGLDIFERKLNTHKAYKTELDSKSSRIVMNIEEEQQKIFVQEDEKNKIIESIDIHYNVQLAEKNEDLTLIQNELIEKNKSLSKIDPKFETMDPELLKKKIDVYNSDIDDIHKKIETKKIDISNLPVLDLAKQETVESDLKTLNESFNNIKQDGISVKSKIDLLNKDIEANDKEQVQTVRDYYKDVNTSVNFIDNDIKVLVAKKEGVLKEATTLKNEIKKLEESLNKKCVTCERPIGEEQKDIINKDITEKKTKLQQLFAQHSDYEKNIAARESEHKNELEKIKDEEKDWSSELKDLVMLVRNKKDDILKQISSENDTLIKLRDEAKDLQNKIKEVEIELKSITDFNKLANTKDSLEKDLTIFAGNIDSKKLQIESIEKDLKDYEFYAEILKDNETKKISIKTTEDLISKLKEEYSELIKGLQKSETEIELINERINKANQQIELYLKQVKIDQLHKAYQTCVHRDGIPTLLLKSMIEHINTELEEMFSEVDFVSYFDENLVLRLSDKNRLDVFQHAISSSGKERTFVALGLKMALRTINKKSKPDILLLDEIMGKLIGTSVDEFRDLLNIAKQKVSRLLIIEHVHHIDYDHLIEVTKSSEGVTSLN